MSELREAAQAALEHWDKVSGIFRMTTETNRLRAALAQPETTAEPVAWLNRYHAAMVTQDHATAAVMGFTTPLYAHPPRDEWREAVIERLIICCIYRSEHDLDPNLALRELIDWEVKIALDPDVSNRAQELINLGRRSVDPTLE